MQAFQLVFQICQIRLITLWLQQSQQPWADTGPSKFEMLFLNFSEKNNSIPTYYVLSWKMTVWFGYIYILLIKKLIWKCHKSNMARNIEPNEKSNIAKFELEIKNK